jgi:hypothetical protein
MVLELKILVKQVSSPLIKQSSCQGGVLFEILKNNSKIPENRYLAPRFGMLAVCHFVSRN